MLLIFYSNKEQFCKTCGHPIEIFQIEVCNKMERGVEFLRVFSSCSNKLCGKSSNIVVQETYPGDVVYNGKFTTYKNEEGTVTSSWNLYESKYRDDTFKKLSEKLLKELKEQEYR